MEHRDTTAAARCFPHMGPAHITPGWLVLDKHVDVRQDGGIGLEPGTREALDQVVDRFSAALSGRRPLRAAA